MLGTDADLLLMSGTCGALDAEAGRAYWLAEAVHHDYGTVRPYLFDRDRACDWPAGRGGEAYFGDMAVTGSRLTHTRTPDGHSTSHCPHVAAAVDGGRGATVGNPE